jgi:hypothetical protein
MLSLSRECLTVKCWQNLAGREIGALILMAIAQTVSDAREVGVRIQSCSWKSAEMLSNNC